MKPVFEWVYTPQVPSRSTAAARPAAAPSSENTAISDRIGQAFDAASSTTGTSFEYLLKTAQRESALNPSAKAKSSTATGLFQFIESTWLETMKQAGPSLGYAEYAAKIEVGADGRYRVSDPDDKAAILALREDPETASLMAGALTRKNAAYLSDRLGRTPNSGELYIAHFLGAAGAASMIELAQSSPDESAADHFPRQAAANRPIFYEGGEALTVSAVYADLVSKHGGTTVAVDPTTAVFAAYAAEAPPRAMPPGLDDATAVRVAAGWRAVTPTDAFSGLFRTDVAMTPSVPTGAGFWQGYRVAPAMFDVAVAEDAEALAAAPLPQVAHTAASPSIAGIAAAAAASGPLDLSRFLDGDES